MQMKNEDEDEENELEITVVHAEDRVAFFNEIYVKCNLKTYISSYKKNELIMIHFIFSSILGGMMIGIGGSVFLHINNTIIGSVLFSIGLLTILSFNWNLFTGKVGYIELNRKSIITVIAIFILNAFGTMIIALFNLHHHNTGFHIKAFELVNTKMYHFTTQHWIYTLYAGILCGMLMYIAVSGWNIQKNSDFLKTIIVMLCVTTFILCGYEHSVADMFYFLCVYNILTFEHVKFIFCVVCGNAVGAVAIHKFYSLSKCTI